MYTNEDLTDAVSKGIFSQESVDQFRQDWEERNQLLQVDQENFRLLNSFNDVFVTIASILFLVSVYITLVGVNPHVAAIVCAGLSWGLSEFFIRKKRMALPAITLLFAFVGCAFISPWDDGFDLESYQLITGSLLAIAAAVCHWLRFRVPISVAAGFLAGVGFVIALLFEFFPVLKSHSAALWMLGGITAFALALRWDAADTLRQTRKSDVAFWLHLLAAPMMVHSFVVYIGFLDGELNGIGLVTALALYAFLVMISIIIDRRALMVSSMSYVLIGVGYYVDDFSEARILLPVFGVVLGFALLMISGFWHGARQHLVARLPDRVAQGVPPIRTLS